MQKFLPTSSWHEILHMAIPFHRSTGFKNQVSTKIKVLRSKGDQDQSFAPVTVSSALVKNQDLNSLQLAYY